MKTIEERAKEYAPDPFDPDYILPAREGYIVEKQRNAYIAGATEQKELTLKAFDKWLCEYSWITRDEGNRKPLEELRNIIQNI